METTAKLLDMALKAVGPVQLGGLLYESAESVYRGAAPAPPETQEARGLYVEIVSPMDGRARKAE
jgi:hypothetical protein